MQQERVYETADQTVTYWKPGTSIHWGMTAWNSWGWKAAIGRCEWDREWQEQRAN